MQDITLRGGVKKTKNDYRKKLRKDYRKKENGEKENLELKLKKKEYFRKIRDGLGE